MTFIATGASALRCAGVLLAGLFAVPLAAQEAYPARPIRIVVPLGPGGSSDLGARIFARRLADEWGQPVVVENRPGGNHIVGTSAVLAAPADAHTLLWTTGGLVAAPVVMKNVPFDAFRDFQPITLAARSNQAIVVSQAVPGNTLASFLAHAKQNPGRLHYGTTGGSVTLLIEHFAQTTGIVMTPVNYKSSPATWADLLGGQIHMMIEGPGAAMAQTAGGRAKIVATTGKARSVDAPDIATVSEQGFPGFDLYSWQGLFVRAGTPVDRVARVKNAAARIMAVADVRAQFVKIGVDPVGSSAEELAEVMRRELDVWRSVAAKANFKPE